MISGAGGGEGRSSEEEQNCEGAHSELDSDFHDHDSPLIVIPFHLQARGTNADARIDI